MTTQSVITQTANLFGSAPVSTTTKGKQAEVDFGFIMDNSLKVSKVTDRDTDKLIRNNSLQNTKSKKNDASYPDSEQRDDLADTTSVITEDRATTDIADSRKKMGTKVTETSKEPTLSEEEQMAAQITVMLQSIRETVMEILKLSAEELDQLMSEQGIELINLIEPQSLQQLVLETNSTSDVLAVLTDENLSVSLTQLLQSVEEIKSDTGLALTDDQMKNIFMQVEANTMTSEIALDEAIISTMNYIHADSSTGEKEKALLNDGSKDEEKGNIESDKHVTTSNEAVHSSDTKDTSSDMQSDLNNKENQDLKADDHFQSFLNNLVNSTQETQADFSGNLTQVTEIRDIANQIIERIKVSIRPDQSTMELQLTPENLGRVNLTVQSKNGVMTAQFLVQNDISKEAIESQLHILRESLNQQGVKVEAIEVTVSAYAFEQNSNESQDARSDEEKNHSGKHISMEEALNMTDTMDEALMDQNLATVLGSQIDYTA